jgi:hypothetical protein
VDIIHITPYDENKKTNRRLLEKELSDLYTTANIMADKQDFNYDAISIESTELKKIQILKYMHYQENNS